ncbi:MAG TPA: hypothetical protein VMU38_04720 [Candidatus Binatia bacterium]|nr:hypothetical protein [Candidatus Binatia bacterium]
MNGAGTVQAFAVALDAEDYETALALLEPAAAYHRDGQLISGAPAIVESFRKSAEWGRSKVDALEFSHEIDEALPSEIVFIDIFRCENDALEIRHAMELTISQRGLISELRFVSTPGEREMLNEFLRRHGVR